MNTSRQLLHRITLIVMLVLLAGLAVYSSIHEYQTASAAANEVKGDDMVTAWDRRLRKIRSLLPESGIVGYVADWDIPGFTYGSSDQEVEFLLAQYSVSPVVLERGVNHKLILGNFSDNGDSTKIEKVQTLLGIKLLQPYTNEIFLFEGQEK
ncbi:MAG: hypothetical protein GYA15_09255 [Leptolinea sp.]|nr:hypothetical protein [Leptolinea sp.]